MTRHAQCACGSFKLTVDAEPAVTGICSCLDCQRRSGSILGAMAYFPKEGVRVVSGQYKTFARISDAGNKLHQHFCPECGTTLLIDADSMPGLQGVPVGCFADPTFPPPQVATYGRTRHSWITLPKDLPTFHANPSPEEIAAVLTKK
jgi:hypothetical protein